MAKRSSLTPCPPHHWLIDDAAGRERWLCCRCGAEHRPARSWQSARRLSNHATWARDEIALVEANEDTSSAALV
jgi:hypothetical protein